MLTSKKHPEEQLQFFQMHENTERLLHLVNQLLDLSRLESGILQLKPEPVSIFSFLHQLAGNFHSLADQKQLNYEIDIPQQALNLLVDKDKLEKNGA